MKISAPTSFPQSKASASPTAPDASAATSGAAQKAKEAPTPPPHAEGMGARYTPGQGTTFRVWAPFTKSVALTGEVIGGEGAKEPALEAEGDGYWALALPDAKPGQGYRFVIETAEGERLERIDPCARIVDEAAHCARIYDDTAFDWGDTPFEMPAWNTLTVYELHIGTFYQGPQNEIDPAVRPRHQPDPGPVQEGDPATAPVETPKGIAPMRVGDFYLAAEKLDHLASLGINAVKVMPPAEFPGDDSWGYNPTYIYAVEAAYGGPDALKHFVKEAHARGMAVLIDVVYNHLGPLGMDMWRFDGWHEGEGGGIYFYNDHRAETPWGHTRPDFGRPEVRRYLIDNALMWLGDYRCDGIRVDSVIYTRSVHGTEDPDDQIPEGWTFLQELNTRVHEAFPWKITIAEDLQQNEWVTKPVDEGGAGFDTQWDGAFVYPIRQALVALHDEARSMASVAQALTERHGQRATARLIYTESHDEVAEGKVRVVTEIAPGEADSWYAIKRAMMGLLMAATSPGIPMLFQGQEFCFDRDFHSQNPVDWSRLERFRGLVQLVSDSLRLRRNLEGRTLGLTADHIDVLNVDEDRNLVAYHRYQEGGPGDSVLIVANLSAQPAVGYRIPLPLEGVWTLELNSDSSLYHPEFTDCGSMALESHDATHDEAVPTDAAALIDIGPYTVLIYSYAGPGPS